MRIYDGGIRFFLCVVYQHSTNLIICRVVNKISLTYHFCLGFLYSERHINNLTVYSKAIILSLLYKIFVCTTYHGCCYKQRTK